MPNPDRAGNARAPIAALLFGLGGLIPFAGLATGLIAGLGTAPVLSAALVTYGAVILSFLGGIRWGFAVKSERLVPPFWDYAFSVIPALAGWAAIFLSLPLAYWVLAGAFVIWFAAEIALPSPVDLPGWYLRLRALLTAGATVSLVAAALAW